MCCEKLILYFLMYLRYACTQDEVLTDTISNFNEAIISNNIKTEWVNETTSYVWIQDKLYYQIYIYKPKKDLISKIHFSTPNEFYICINCEFAAWIRDQLFEFVKRFPLLYHSRFLYVHNNLFIRRFKIFVKTLDSIMKYTERFINILFNFLKINKYNSSFDTVVFKTLISLNLKILFFKTLRMYENGIDNSNTNKSVDDIIIRSILEIINSLQYFISVNCKFSSYYINIRFYGYPSTDSSTSINNIFKFFHSISWIESLDHCIVEQIISKDIINLIHKNMEWNSPYGKVLVRDVIKTIQHSYNIDTIFWCQELMLKSIMKMLFYKILRVFKNHQQFSKNILSYLKEIYHYIFSNLQNLSTELMQSFTLLISKRNHVYAENDELVLLINKYLESLDEFNLKADVASSSNITDKMNASNEGFSENYIFTDVSNDESDLDQYLSRILAIIKDFRCFIKFYEFLQYESNNTYYMPFMRNTVNKKSLVEILIMESNANKSKMSNSAIASIKNDVHRNLTDEKCVMIEEGCNYIKGLYEFCLQTIFVLNSHETKNYYTKAKEIFMNVETYLKAFFNASHWDRPIFIIAYTILPLVQNTNNRFNQPFNLQVYNDLTRLINMVMILFDKYGLEFCSTPPKYNYLLFNHINFNLFKIDQSIPQIPNGIIESLNKFEKSNNNRRVAHTLFSLNHFYKVYSNSANLSVYNKVIKLNWKGENWNINEIYKYIISAVLSPFYWYKINEFFLKFYIAVIFYEINEIYKINDVEIFECGPFYRNIQDYLLRNKFPSFFNKIIDNIKKYLIILNKIFCNKEFNNTIVIIEKIETIFNQINFQLVEIGVNVIVERPILSNDASKSPKLSQVADSRFNESSDSVKFRSIVDNNNTVLISTLNFLNELFKLFYSVEEISYILTRMIVVERLDNNGKLLYHISF